MSSPSTVEVNQRLEPKSLLFKRLSQFAENLPFVQRILLRPVSERIIKSSFQVKEGTSLEELTLAVTKARRTLEDLELFDLVDITVVPNNDKQIPDSAQHTVKVYLKRRDKLSFNVGSKLEYLKKPLTAFNFKLLDFLHLGEHIELGLLIPDAKRTLAGELPTKFYTTLNIPFITSNGVDWLRIGLKNCPEDLKADYAQYTETNLTAFLKYSSGAHTFGPEFSLRKVSPNSSKNSSANALRVQGIYSPSLKASLIYYYNKMQYDKPPVMTKGSHSIFRAELAGLCDVSFIKTDAFFQKFVPISHTNFSFGISAAGGIYYPLFGKSSNIIDQSHLASHIPLGGFQFVKPQGTKECLLIFANENE